jgi:hypothetical protein
LGGNYTQLYTPVRSYTQLYSADIQKYASDTQTIVQSTAEERHKQSAINRKLLNNKALKKIWSWLVAPYDEIILILSREVDASWRSCKESVILICPFDR